MSEDNYRIRETSSGVPKCSLNTRCTIHEYRMEFSLLSQSAIGVAVCRAMVDMPHPCRRRRAKREYSIQLPSPWQFSHRDWALPLIMASGYGLAGGK